MSQLELNDYGQTSIGDVVQDQSPEEEKTVRMVEKLFREAKAHRSKYDSDWLDNYKMFRGKQWKEQRPYYRHSDVINLIFQSIQSSIPILTDAQASFEYLPMEPNDTQISVALNDLSGSDWQRLNWLMVETEALYDSHIYGTAFTYMGYNPDKNYKAGEIEWCTKDPFYIYPDPAMKEINDEKGRYIIEAEPRTLREIKRLFPSKGHLVKSDVSSDKDDRTNIREVQYISPTENALMTTDTPRQESSSNKALLVTCYLMDDEFTEEPKDNGVNTTYTQKLKYPNGRKIVYANGVLLFDDHNPYDDGKFPYQRLINYILPREFYGESDVTQAASPQRAFNKLVCFALDVLTLMGNPVWVVDSTSGVDINKITNQPGLVIPKEPNSTVQRVEGVQLQPYVLQLIDKMQSWFQDITGRHDVSEGVKPVGADSGYAISTLLNATQTRLRQKARNMDIFLQSVGQAYRSRVFQFYSAPRVARLLNDQGSSSFFKFHVEDMGDGRKQAVIRRYQKNPDGQSTVSLEEERYDVPFAMDTRVSVGSGLAFNKAENEQRLLNLFDRGIIDEEEVLKKGEYPGWEIVLQRVQQKKMQMAQAQQQAQMQKQGAA